MPELKKNFSPALMNCIGYLLPARDLIGGINTGCPFKPDSLSAYLRSFSNDEASRSPLGIVRDR
jgi:hypothetical protein